MATTLSDKKPEASVSVSKEKFRSGIYECELHDRGGDYLIISLSHKKNFAFYNYKWRYSVLFVCDPEDRYYCRSSDDLAKLVREYCITNGYKNVVFFGLSKGGSGALILSALLAGLSQDISVRAISFSGQLLLYPENQVLPFPTYKAMMRDALSDEGLRGDLIKFGDITKLDYQRPNLHWVFVYGEKCEMDVREATRIVAPNVRKYPIPFGFHGSSIPFCIDRQDEKNIRSEVSVIFKNASKEVDLKATLPSSEDDMADEISAANWIPKLVDFVEGVLIQDFV